MKQHGRTVPERQRGEIGTQVKVEANEEEEFEGKIIAATEEAGVDSMMNKLWNELSPANIENCKARAEEIRTEFARRYPSDFIAVEVGSAAELYGFIDREINRNGMEEYYNSLWLSIENVEQHGGDFGFLLLRVAQPAGRDIRCSFVLMDRGEGFVDHENNPAPIHEAVRRGVSFGRKGVKGMGLTHTVASADEAVITTINGLSEQAHRYSWKKGQKEEERLTGAPVPRGTKVEFECGVEPLLYSDIFLGEDFIVRAKENPKKEKTDVTNGFPLEIEEAHAINFRTVLGYIRGKEERRALRARLEAESYLVGPEGMIEPRSTIVAVGKSWLKGYERGTDQYLALNPLITMLKTYCEKRDVPFIIADDDEIPALIAKEKAERGMSSDTKTVILAGANKEGMLSQVIRGLTAHELFTVVGVDSTALTDDSYIRIMELLTIALGLSIGIEPSLDNEHMTIFPPAGKRNFYIIVPHPEPMDYELLKSIYNVQKYA